MWAPQWPAKSHLQPRGRTKQSEDNGQAGKRANNDAAEHEDEKEDDDGGERKDTCHQPTPLSHNTTTLFQMMVAFCVNIVLSFVCMSRGVCGTCCLDFLVMLCVWVVFFFLLFFCWEITLD